MSATFIDYTIAIGAMLVAFSAVVSVAAGFATSAQTDIRLSTLQMQALSLLDLSDREYAFDTSISGLGLVATIVNNTVQPQEIKNIVGAASLQLLSSKQYSDMREDFDFRIRIFDSDNTTAFSYGPMPPLANVVVLQKPVLYESPSIRSGTFMVEVW